ncbi:HD domain-containing protein [Alkalihalobacillus sp. 1P02AB]|uniref:HD domain-containing protein n=1 Tax=Alkalihalobacillus sp. 1P02AB TaxID=3132260 RepID=UPI0039A54962
MKESYRNNDRLFTQNKIHCYNEYSSNSDNEGADMIAINEPLYPHIQPLDWENELFSSRYVRRLKHLAHYGGGALVSSVTHSRFEHTVGVWKLVLHFFPNDLALRAAAILHDIGHLPFSHAVERTLKFNHHQLTNQYIQSNEIAEILNKINLQPDDMIQLLDSQSPLMGSEKVLGLDHLDSFLRDNYMNGTLHQSVFSLLEKISCSNEGISTDDATVSYLLELIYKDHQLMLSPLLLAVDRLLAEAVKLHWPEPEVDFPFYIDSEVTAKLLESPNPKVKKIIDTLLFEPNKINISETVTGEGILIQSGKIYGRLPLKNGQSIEHTKEGRGHKEGLASFLKTYEVNI